MISKSITINGKLFYLNLNLGGNSKQIFENSSLTQVKYSCTMRSFQEPVLDSYYTEIMIHYQQFKNL